MSHQPNRTSHIYGQYARHVVEALDVGTSRTVVARARRPPAPAQPSAEGPSARALVPETWWASVAESMVVPLEVRPSRMAERGRGVGEGLGPAARKTPGRRAAAPGGDLMFPADLSDEHAYRERKTTLGLDHFRGRSFTGRHRHVTVVTAAHLFLDKQRTCPKAPARAWPSARPWTSSVSGHSDNAARCRSCRCAPVRDYGTALRCRPCSSCVEATTEWRVRSRTTTTSASAGFYERVAS
jgi:hypothetical protein